jgi:hypothetical protein
MSLKPPPIKMTLFSLFHPPLCLLFVVVVLLHSIVPSHAGFYIANQNTPLVPLTTFATRNHMRQSQFHGGHSLSFTQRFTSSTVHNSFPNGVEDDTLNDDLSSNNDKLPKYSQSIPFLARPKHLTLEFAGDVGFDPLNFCQNRDLLLEYREAEIKHSRLAMLAAVGWPVSELYDVKIANILQQEPVVDAADRVPSLFNGGMEKINPVWWGFCLGLTAAIDLYGVNRARTVDGYTPGDLGWDPLNLYPAKEDVKGRSKMQLAEIKHGRLAMVAVTAYSVQEYVTGVGIVDETPLFFKPIEVLEEVLEKAVL